MTTLQDKLKKLPKKRQTKIQKRADELIADEMTLRDLRLVLSPPYRLPDIPPSAK